MRIALLVLAALLLAACGPTFVLPGGRLAGPVEGAPADWSFSDAVQTIQLETRPEDPYSVNVWGVGVGEHFYVAAASEGNRWAEHIASDPRVRLRIEESVYELQAVRSDDPEDRQAFLAAVKRKYDWEPDDEQAKGALLFRLGRRP